MHTREWRKCGSVMRPPDIPSNPNQIYKDDFVSMLDWLGLPLQRPRIVPPPMAALNERQMNGTHHTRISSQLAALPGMDVFRLFPTPRREVAVDLLFQPRETLTPQLWCGVSLRVATTIQKDGRAVFNRPSAKRFRVEQRAWDLADVFYDASRDKWFVVGEPINTPTVNLRHGGNGRFDGCHVEHSSVAEVLAKLYEERPLFTKQEWLLRNTVSEKDEKSVRALVDLWRLLYDPCSVNVCFPTSGVECHNLELNEKRVLHRCAQFSLDKKTDKGLALTLCKKFGGHRFPYSDTDNIDFVSHLVTDATGQPQLCFLFPKTVLIERKIFHTTGSDDGGQMTIGINIPGRRVRTSGWQHDFFLDLREPDNLWDTRKKFLKILNSD